MNDMTQELEVVRNQWGNLGHHHQRSVHVNVLAGPAERVPVTERADREDCKTRGVLLARFHLSHLIGAGWPSTAKSGHLPTWSRSKNGPTSVELGSFCLAEKEPIARQPWSTPSP